MLAPKPFDVLCHLVQRAGELVARTSFSASCGPIFTSPNSSLSVSINAIRLALGDNSRAPRYSRPRPAAAIASSRRSRRAATARKMSEAVPRRRRPRADWRVGRDAALAKMERWFEEAAAGRRSLAFVTGEAGIGKTTFAEMLLDRMAGRDVGILVGRCIEHFGGDEAFLPLNEAFAAGCAGRHGALARGMLRDRAPTWLAQLPGAVAGQDSDALKRETFGASRERMLREFCELLEALSVERPWILFIEDLHWSDYATLDAIARFANRERRAAVLTVANYRPADARVGAHPVRAMHQELQIHGRCAEVALSKLSPEEIGRYLDLRFGASELSGALAPELARRTGGHPCSSPRSSIILSPRAASSRTRAAGASRPATPHRWRACRATCAK